MDQTCFLWVLHFNIFLNNYDSHQLLFWAIIFFNITKFIITSITLVIISFFVNTTTTLFIFGIQGTEMLTTLQELVIADNNPPIEDMTPPTAPPAPAANAIAHTDVQMEVLRILQEIQQNNAGCRRKGGRGGRGGRGCDSREREHLNPDNTNFPGCITDKYCHTHGGCNNTSPDCTRKANRHNNAVTI